MTPVEDLSRRPSRVRFLGDERDDRHARWYALIAEHYDAMNGPDRPRLAAEFLHEAFQRHGPVAHVLDAACGTFSIDLELLGRGYDVVGCDASPHMLDAARRNLRDAGQDAELLHADMREVEVSQRFDAVLCLGTAFNYLAQDADWRNVLGRFHDHLRGSGALVLDLANFEKWIDKPENAGVDLEYTAPDGTRMTFFRCNEQNADRSQHLARFFSVFQRDGDVDLAWDEALLKVWRRNALSAALEEHGFRPTEWWGELHAGTAYDPSASPRLVCVATRA